MRENETPRLSLPALPHWSTFLHGYGALQPSAYSYTLPSLTISPLVRPQRLDLLLDPRRTPHRDTPRRYISRHDTCRRNSAPFSNRHTRKDNHIRSDPAIVTNNNGLRELDIVSSTLHLGFMRRR